MTEDKNDSNEGCLQGCLQSIKSILYSLFTLSIIVVILLSVSWLIIKFFRWIFGFFGWIFSVSIWLGIVISIISIISIILVGIFVYFLTYDTANSDDNEREDDKKQTKKGETNIFISSKDSVNVFVKSDRAD